MNREIEKYYITHIDKNQSEYFIREALVSGIRSDNAKLTRNAASALHFRGDFFGHSSPLVFAIKEMASAGVIRALTEAGYKLSRPCHDLTPFDGSPENLADLLMEINGKTKEVALQVLATDIAYFFHVIRTNYSCYRIPCNIDSEDRYKPCFWNYLDQWMSDFIKLLIDEKCTEIMDSYFIRSIIENAELKKAFDTLIELLGKTFCKDDLIWYINIAVSHDNEHAFEKLFEYSPSLIKEVNCYPSSSRKILSTLFDKGILAPGTNEGFNAFVPFISYGKTDKDILCSIVHPSYPRRTIEDGVTPLMVAVKNEDFPVELYKFLITSPDDINMQDEDGKTALHYMAETEYPECIETLLKLGTDPFIRDNKGNNVLHILAENKGGLSFDIFSDCISLLPKKLLTMENSNGMTPITLFFQRLTGTEEDPYKKLSFNQFLEQYLASPESMNGNLLIGGSNKETRLKTLSLVRDQVIRQLNNRAIEFELIADKSPEETVYMLEKLADEEIENNTSSPHLIIIDELYDCLSPELGVRFEYAVHQLDGNADVLIIAASKFSSADIITDIIQHAFPYRITSKQSSDLTSKIFIGEDYAAYIGQEEVIIKGFVDDLLLSNLKSDGIENEEMDEDSIVLAEAERILEKHLSAFKELAK